jgi:hypothetical protein
MSESDPYAEKKKKETVEGMTSGNVISLREAEKLKTQQKRRDTSESRGA